MWDFRFRAPLASIKRNRAPWALLASLAVCLFVLEPFKVPFNPVIWIAIDLAVAAAIIRFPMSDMPTRDIVVLALFFPGLAFYTMEPEVRYQGGLAVVITQLLLTFPAVGVRDWLRARLNRGHGNGSDRLSFVAA